MGKASTGNHIRSHHNPLDVARMSFRWLTTGPRPVSVDGNLFDHLPDREIPVDELRELLLRRDCPHTTWDQVWAHVIRKSRQHGGTWTVVAVGLALDGLIPIAARLTRYFRGDPSDIHADILRGFLDAVDSIDLDQGAIMIRLWWAAYRAGHRALTTAMDEPTPSASGFRSSEPKPPTGHPDLILARAVAAGVLTETEAAMIGDTRLDKVLLLEWAADRNLSYAQMQSARYRAEKRLVLWLTEATAPVEDDPTGGVVATRLGLTAGRSRTSRSRKVTKKSGMRLPAEALSSGLHGCGRSLPAVRAR